MFESSVFAYGATGAGKTHTMLGNEREPGVIYHTMIDLYKKINEQKEEKMFDVAVSYSEVSYVKLDFISVYNNNINDTSLKYWIFLIFTLFVGINFFSAT